MISVSIIIPIYKVEDYILDCLQSVANQTYSGPIECLCVDDCSPDNSVRMVEQYIRNYSGSIKFVLLRHERNRGVSAARNTGIDSSTGDYILFLDGDDQLTDDCVELFVQSLQKKVVSFAVADFSVYPEDQESIFSQNLRSGEILYGGKVLDSFTHKVWFQSPVNRLYNSLWLKSNGIKFIEGLYAEDNLWCFETSALADSMLMLNRKTYIVNRNRTESLSNTQNGKSKLINSQVEMIAYMRDFIKEHELANNFYVYNHYQAFSRVSIVKVYENGGGYERAMALYENWRESGLYPKLKILRFASKSLRSFVRDFHYFLPRKLGFKYMVKIEKYK